MYIFPYKKEWKSEFCTERDLIRCVCENRIDLYHIGSTAIEGLYAKDCIDILGVVNNISEVSCEVENFKSIGYGYKGSYGITGREYFSKAKRKVHFHVFEVGDINIAKHLRFIEVMSASPELVTELNRLKLELHNTYPNSKDLYQKEKEYFYNEIHKML